MKSKCQCQGVRGQSTGKSKSLGCDDVNLEAAAGLGDVAAEAAAMGVENVVPLQRHLASGMWPERHGVEARPANIDAAMDRGSDEADEPELDVVEAGALAMRV
eukprot:640590-Rhodomonas_salina.1